MRYPRLNLAAQRWHQSVTPHRACKALAAVQLAVLKQQLQMFLQYQVVAWPDRRNAFLIPTRHRHTNQRIP